MMGILSILLILSALLSRMEDSVEELLTKILLRDGPIVLLVCWMVFRADRREARLTDAILTLRQIICPLRAGDLDDTDGSGGSGDEPAAQQTHRRRARKPAPPASVLTSTSQ